MNNRISLLSTRPRSAARMVTAMMAALALGGCSGVLSGTPQEVWVEEPAVSLRSPETVAARHCAQYGRQAVLKHRLAGGDGADPSYPRGRFVPIWVFECR